MSEEFRADLHCHSRFSDGSNTVAELIDLAIAQGLSALSITDHDTIAAYDEALPLAKNKNFPLLSGAEFSAMHGKEPVHILAYAFDLKSEKIAALCARHQLRREQRNQRILDRLRGLGFPVNLDELPQDQIKGSIGRPHIAYLLWQKGVVGSIQEAFERYLGEGKPAYDPGEPISVEETITIIKEGRGKAVLAHPHLIKRSTTVRAVLKMPFDGLECYYARFDASQEKKWVDLAHQRKWLITGGSDYHGATKPYSALGTSWVGKETFDTLYAHFLSVNRL